MTYAQPTADPTNVVGRRIAAYAIDLVLIAALSLAIVIPMFFSASKTAPSTQIDCSSSEFDSGSQFDDPQVDEGSPTKVDSNLCFDDGDTVRYIPSDDAGSFTAKAYLAGFGIQALNLVLLQGLVGASIGKLLLGLRVVTEDGRTAGIGRAALRWVLLFVDSLCCFLPGAVLVFTTKGHRRLGDMAASTFVVRTRSVGSPILVPGVTTGYGTPGYGGTGYGAAGYGQAGPGGWPAGPAGPAGPANGGWGAPGTGQPTAWSPPGAPSTPSTPPAPGTPPAAGDASSGEGPTWDAARNAYIQYDREHGAWVQWNDQAQAWLPIDQ